MKTLRLVMLILSVALLSTGCPRRNADLAITQFVTAGTATVNAQDEVEVPVLVVIENQGNADAPAFRVTTTYDAGLGPVTVPFTVDGQADPAAPWTSESLDPGEQIGFTGIITIPQRQVAVELTAFADSCIDEVGLPEYCRVDESDEDNNFSQLNVNLP